MVKRWKIVLCCAPRAAFGQLNSLHLGSGPQTLPVDYPDRFTSPKNQTTNKTS